VENTDLKTGRGIFVDRHMETNIADVYACGDVSEGYDFLLSEDRVLPQWSTVYRGGRVAGYNMAGLKIEYPGSTVMSALKYFGVPILAAGITNPENEEGYSSLTVHDPERRVYKKIVLKDGVVKGFIFVNEIGQAGMIFHLMKRGLRLEELEERLLAPDFDLVHLPEDLREDILVESCHERLI